MLFSIVFMQCFLLIILYNEIFNVPKLELYEAAIEVSENAKQISDDTKNDYIGVQNNLLIFLKTKDVNDNTSINNTSINIGLGGCSMEEMERQLRKSMETMFSRDKRINSR